MGLRTAVALIVGEVIAVGIFLTPADMTRTVGSPFWLLVIWLSMGALAICGAFCYGELAARFPQAGGGYVYLREAYGRPVAFLYGWKVFLVLDPGLTATLAVGLASYLAYLVPLPDWRVKAAAIGAIWLMALGNILGARLGAWVIQGLTVIKLGLLALIVVWGFLGGRGDWANLTPFVAQHPGSTAFAAAMGGGLISAFYAFGGWWDVSKMAGEMRNPQRDLPRALTIGVLVVTVVYTLTSLVFMFLVPVAQVTSGETFAAQAGEVLFGPWGGKVFSAIVVISVFGSLAAYLMVAPRVYYALASDGLFFNAIARVSPRFGTPALAIALQAALASILVAFGSFRQIVGYFFFVTVAFIALTVFAIFVFRRRKDSPEPGYRATGYPVTAVIFLVLVLIMLALIGLSSPIQSLIGVGVMLCGLPVYYLLFRKSELKT